MLPSIVCYCVMPCICLCVYIVCMDVSVCAGVFVCMCIGVWEYGRNRGTSIVAVFPWSFVASK